MLRCTVRCRIPSEFGGNCHLLLYEDCSQPSAALREQTQHCAVVFTPESFHNASPPAPLVSRSLNAPLPNDTPYRRALRGAAPLPSSSPPPTTSSSNITNTTTSSTVDEPHQSNSSFLVSSNETTTSLSSPQSSPIGHETSNGHHHPFNTTNTNTNLNPTIVPLVRIHSCCFTGETLGSLRCDCAEQLHAAMHAIATHGVGVILYLKQEGRGIGLADKMRAYNLIDMGRDTLEANIELGHPADARTYDVATDILTDLGVSRLKLLTNNPAKVEHLERSGITIDERISMIPASWLALGTNGVPTVATTNTTTTTTSAAAHHDDVLMSVMASMASKATSSTSDSSSSGNTTTGVRTMNDARSNTPANESTGVTIAPAMVSSSAVATTGVSSSTEFTSSSSAFSTTASESEFSSSYTASNTSPSPDFTKAATTTALDSGKFVAQDRDLYLVTKIRRMGHILDIPRELLGASASVNS